MKRRRRRFFLNDRLGVLLFLLCEFIGCTFLGLLFLLMELLLDVAIAPLDLKYILRAFKHIGNFGFILGEVEDVQHTIVL